MNKMQGKSIKGKKSGITRRKFIATTTGTAAAAFTVGFPNIVMAADPIRWIGRQYNQRNPKPGLKGYRIPGTRTGARIWRNVR